MMPKEKIPGGIKVYVQEKGWVDENVLLQWLNDVWFKRPGALLNRESLLAWDMFNAHRLECVKNKLRERRTHQAVIPGGCTSLLQPLDVCLNKPFKDNLRRQWNTWVIEGVNPLTKAGNIKRPDITTVCQWTIDSWNDISSEIVIRSFIRCGISNSLDGTEDDELYSEFVGGRDEAPESQSSKVDDDYDAAVYDDCTNENQFLELFGNSDSEEEFEGF